MIWLCSPLADDRSTSRETLAILEYLVDRHDNDHKVFSTGPDKYIQLQWLAFQISGHCVVPALPPREDSERDREAQRDKAGLAVLDSVLSKQKYLVGDNGDNRRHFVHSLERCGCGQVGPRHKPRGESPRPCGVGGTVPAKCRWIGADG